MRHLICFLVWTSLSLTAAAAQSDDTLAVERAILWKAKRDSSWAPVEMKQLVQDPERFSKEGNFYKPKSEFKVFGHEVTYLGIIGIGDYPGPNATVRGSAEDISKEVEKMYKIKAAKVEGGFTADLQDNVKLLIFPHPKHADETIIVGAYFGA